VSRSVWRQPEFWTTIAAALVLTAGHYVAPTHDSFWHDLFRRLYYLPIILAGFRYGFKGGLITSGAVSVLYLPHVLVTAATLTRQASEVVFEIPLYLLVGIVTGTLSDRQREAGASVLRTERLKTLGELAAGMAHEVKNPLAAIRSSAQILRDRVSGKEAEFAGIIVSEVDRVDKVVKDFLDYARPAPLRREATRLSRVLDSCIELLGPVAAERGVAINRHWPAGETEVSADANQLRQVFINLLLNAIQALPPRGQVDVSVAKVGKEMRAVVADNGPGIAPDRLQQVFKPFYTTKPGGAGLGMSIAQRIVSEHGGRLLLESWPGKGTVATVVLPPAR